MPLNALRSVLYCIVLFTIALFKLIVITICQWDRHCMIIWSSKAFLICCLFPVFLSMFISLLWIWSEALSIKNLPNLNSILPTLQLQIISTKSPTITSSNSLKEPTRSRAIFQWISQLLYYLPATVSQHLISAYNLHDNLETLNSAHNIPNVGII